MEVLNVREINKVVPLEETLIRQWINIEEYETLQSRVKELEAVTAENIQLKSRLTVLQIELAHKNVADSKLNFKAKGKGEQNG